MNSTRYRQQGQKALEDIYTFLDHQFTQEDLKQQLDYVAIYSFRDMLMQVPEDVRGKVSEELKKPAASQEFADVFKEFFQEEELKHIYTKNLLASINIVVKKFNIVVPDDKLKDYMEKIRTIDSYFS